MKLYSKILLILVLFSCSLFSQWTSEPTVPKSLVIDTYNPINIFTVENQNEGVFIFWEDIKSSGRAEVFYQHINLRGDVTFRADGKTISESYSPKTNPQAAFYSQGIVVVAWKQKRSSGEESIYAQLLKSNGQRLWEDEGVELFTSSEEIISFSLATDKDGGTHVVVLEKQRSAPTIYTVIYQKLTATGYIEHSLKGMKIYSSQVSKNLVKIVPNENKSVKIFWIDAGASNNVYCAIIDSKGTLNFNHALNDVMGVQGMITDFNAIPMTGGFVYLTLQTSGKQREVFHQVVNNLGKPVLDGASLRSTLTRGINYNPASVRTSDGNVVLAWVNLENNDANIYLQKFNNEGKPLWDRMGVSVGIFEREQFSPSISADAKGGVFVVWLDKRDGGNSSKIYAQRFDSRGKMLWDSLAIPVSFSDNPEKSYLTSQFDGKEGVIAVFKEANKDFNGIYGQRILGNKTFVPSISEFSGVLTASEVKLYWEVVNEIGVKGYRVERLDKNGKDSAWVLLDFIAADPVLNSLYEYYDSPKFEGNINYRISILDNKDQVITRKTAIVAYQSVNVSEPFVLQNIPNPFKDKTLINYNIPTKGTVKFEFYNSKFELVKEESITHNSAGLNSYEFQKSGLSSGVYFYRFTFGDFVEVKKMILAQ